MKQPYDYMGPMQTVDARSDSLADAMQGFALLFPRDVLIRVIASLSATGWDIRFMYVYRSDYDAWDRT